MKQDHGNGQIMAVYYVRCAGCIAIHEPSGAAMHNRTMTAADARECGWRCQDRVRWFCRHCLKRLRAGESWPFEEPPTAKDSP